MALHGTDANAESGSTLLNRRARFSFEPIPSQTILLVSETPLSPTRICIDGFNLGLSKGSGIATYARNLNDSLRVLGLHTQILYGPAVRLGRQNLLNQTALHDAPRPPGPLWRRRLARVRP